MVPLDALLKIFSQMAAKAQPVLLLNTYRGVPVSNEAQVLSIHQGYVVFKVHPYQAACLNLEGLTFIQSKLLPEIYRAKTVAVDFSKNQVILTEFSGAGNSIGKRAITRVQPKEPVDAELYDGEHRVPARLSDISTAGVGIFTFATYIYGDLSFEKGAQVYIDFTLPTTQRVIRLQARVTSLVHQQGTFLHRLGLEITPNPSVDKLLKQYVDMRQAELLQELHLYYESMQRLSPLKD